MSGVWGVADRVGSRDRSAQSPVESLHRSRIAALDGLRGCACILVVLLHAWTVVPVPELEKVGPLLGLFKSGSLGVTVFFVLGSFLVTRQVLAECGDDNELRVDRFWMRRLVRLGSQLYLLLIVLWVVSWFDRWAPWTTEQDERSLITSGTFTLNWSLIDDPQTHREDIGHLWYLSVEQQFYLAWIFVLAWFNRFRAALMAVLALAVLAVFAWREHVLHTDGGWVAELSTTTRADGLLLGALAAIALPYLHRWRGLARRVTFPCLAALVVLVLYSTELDQFAFLETQGIVFALVATLLVVGIALARDSNGLAERLLGARALVLIGRVSFPLYLWHYPVFWASSRWASDIDWPFRAVGSVIALTLIVAAIHNWVEQPIVRWLDNLRRPHIDAERTVAAAS